MTDTTDLRRAAVERMKFAKARLGAAAVAALAGHADAEQKAQSAIEEINACRAELARLDEEWSA